MRRKKFLELLTSFALILSLFTGITAQAFADGRIFPDVPADAYYSDALDVLYEMSIFEGDDNGNFNPDKTITRAEMVTLICRLLGVEEEALSHTSVPFGDVADGSWYAGYVYMAAEMGIVEGYGNGKFGPKDPVKYEQVVTMLIRAWGYEDGALSEGGYPDGYIVVADYFGILEGVQGSVGKPIARKDVAVMINNLLDIEPNTIEVFD